MLTSTEYVSFHLLSPAAIDSSKELAKEEESAADSVSSRQS